MGVVGLLGITYSLLSASWEEEEVESEGIGGSRTFNDNLNKIKEGVGRGRKNVRARDTLEQVGGLAEVNRLRREMAEQEAAERVKVAKNKEIEKKRRQDFRSKMDDNL